jgi:hypothetical protein
MRRSTEKIIAMQFLTLLVALTGLFVAQLLGNSHRGSAPTHLISWRGMSVSSVSPWLSLRRLVRRQFWAGRDVPVATVAAQTAPNSPESSGVQ